MDINDFRAWHTIVLLILFIGIVMAQYQPSNYYPIAADFRSTVYQAIVD